MSQLGILIVNWNRHADLLRLLQDLAKQTEPADKILVVDNGSTDGTPELIEEFNPTVRVIRLPENRGLSIGRNIGIDALDTDLIAILDNDLRILDGTFFAKLRRSVAQHPDCGIISFHCIYGVWTRPAPDCQNSFMTMDDLTRMAAGNKAPTPPRAYYDWFFSGGACVIRRSVFESVGIFDPIFMYGGEEWDLAYRCHDAGIRLLRDKGLWVVHIRSPQMRSKSVTNLILKNMVIAQGRYLPLFDLLIFMVMQITKSFADALRARTVGAFLSVCAQIARNWSSQASRKRRPVSHGTMHKFYFLRLAQTSNYGEVENAKTNALDFYLGRARLHTGVTTEPRQYVDMFDNLIEGTPH
jgi:GT2 family glycosyltransferase